VTGASGGVGRATAHEFAKRGAKVALVARDPQGLQQAASEVQALGGQPLAVPTDVADAAQVEAAAERAETELGPIDIWVNDAMATVFAWFTETTPEEFTRATEVTYLGAVYGTMAALKRMVPRDRGTVVQVGSALSYRAIPLQAAYCGAKFGMRGFTDSVRVELMAKKSRVWITMVQLPGLNTPQFNWCHTKLPNHPMPVPPIFQPEVAAQAIVWASQHRRKEVYVGRSTVIAIIGDKLASAAADRYLARTGYGSQLTEEPDDDGRPDNLLEPLDAEIDRGMHGRFDDRATDGDPQTWFVTHRRLATSAAAGAAALAWLARRR
jgi:NAD(P)-dependent dehydrogenase (short-subunit alcohol dehydrogenase family)